METKRILEVRYQRRKLLNKKYLILIAAIIATFVSTYGYTNYFGPQTVIQINSDQNCRQGNVLDDVDRQARFKVLSTCQTAVGIVHEMSKQDDVDYQFNLEVNDTYKKLLNDANNNQVNGMLVIEIIPKDQNSNLVAIPKDGDKIEAIGEVNVDHDKKWDNWWTIHIVAKEKGLEKGWIKIIEKLDLMCVIDKRKGDISIPEEMIVFWRYFLGLADEK